MNLAIIPLVALGLITSVPAGAQDVAPGLDSPRGDIGPRTKRERDLGLEGKPRGQEEQTAPDDTHSTEEPDYDADDDLDDVVPGVPPRSPRRP